MQSEDRPIHFSTELIYPPFPLKAPAIQKLYYELSQTPGAGYDNVELGQQGPPRLHSRRDKTQSFVLFLPDRLAIVEEWVDAPMAAFLSRAEDVARNALEVFELPAYTAQAVTIRTTFALSYHEDARAFMLERVCGQHGRIGPHFARPIGVAGLRLFFPEGPDLPGDYNITIESYRQSRNEIFVESKGVFRNQDIRTATIDTCREHIQATRDFISDRVYPYLQQYDQPWGEEA